MSEIVQFGRYKGRPVEDMLADRWYCEKMLENDWFAKKHPNLRLLILNVIPTDNIETPEHNAMQVAFLSEEYQGKVFSRFLPIKPPPLRVKFEDNRLGYYSDSCSQIVSEGERFKLAKKTVYFTLNPIPEVKYTASFEVSGWDVKIKREVTYRATLCEDGSDSEVRTECAEYYGDTLCLELKTYMSDDFPSVLRQMQKNRIRARATDYIDKFALICREFSSSVATEDQITKYFGASNFGVWIQGYE